MPQGWMVQEVEGSPLALHTMMDRRESVTVPVVAAGRCCCPTTGRCPGQEAGRPTTKRPQRGVGVRCLRGGLNGELTGQVEKVEVSEPEVQGADRP